MLRAWLVAVSEPAIVVIDAIAMLVILAATVHTFVWMLRIALSRDAYDNHHRRDVWLSYGRWLVAGLTFQLAADVVESSVVPTWQGIGQLAAIAVIRTFLNYFLERDIAEIRERQHGPRPMAQPEP